MDKRELYDEVCKVLTWFENPDESGLDENEFNRQIADEMYVTLVCVQHFLCDEFGF
jgi:hypothetical protein